MAEDPDNKVDIARRRLLRIAVYTPPAVLGALALNNAAGCAPSTCGPTPCSPGSTCGPSTCNPVINPCGPDSCNPSTCNPKPP